MFKKITLLTFLALAVFVIGGQTANAQETRLSSSPAAFRTFFSQFKAAVKRGDKAAVAAMTRFPFEYGFDVGDEGKMSRAQFIKRFSEIFGKSPSRFCSEKNPQFSRDGSRYIILTEDAENLNFVKKGSGYKFMAYIVEP